MPVPESVPALPRVLAVNPVHRPSARLAAAAARAGALGVLELPDGDATALLDQTARWAGRPFGVRLRPDRDLPELPDLADTILLADPDRSPADFPGRRVLVEVGDLDAARAAIAAGAAGLVARGAESGGRVGSLATFVLLQRLLAEVDLPVWACGGIGPRTAAAAVAGGAAGVVLDTQLALLPEAGLPAEVTDLLTGLDGSETVLRDGVRVLRRRDTELPAGQDAFLAERFAARWRTVAAVVRGIEAEIDSVGTSAVRILGSRSAGSAALGTNLPVAQGPMTRVSDQPEFAAAVAKAGALPFLALALANAEQTRSMLTRTRDALGHLPWGVGILGFADEQVRTAQLDVVREVKPTHAIIAGGKPGQAAALEAEGISTFLHVPSPGLLKQFLAAGARKFVFEGAECGGHVGPRNSFPLWEAQVDVLLEQGADGVTVLFAGGVHDERSAAMVAALAAPLAEAGASVGLLMGTAYLFTEEAVAAGAIQPLFQRQVVDAERTDLLETAPGHATRCVHSGFTADFAATKDRLKAEGVADRDAWEQLEQLNIGRLRLASKGIERSGAELREVGEDRQAAEGMFMAGEVAVLRDRVTTLAELHHSVGDGAAQWLATRVTPAETQAPQPKPLRVAVVGMACMFPGAPDLASFWANVVSAKDSVTEVPAQRWDADLYYAEGGDGERTPSRWGGFLPEIDFDPLAYGIPPASLASIEPVQLLALEAARRALADAGLTDADHARTSVVFGAEAGSDLSNATALRTVLPSYLGEIPAELDDQLPRLTEDSFPGMLANVIAGRIANRLDLGGANYTVDAACASSLTAVDVACKELTAGTSDLVVCGGADLHNGINDFLLFSSVHALSPSGRSATFDQSGDGIALGEGVACVVLKRLEDAERDGDRVYAVIDGVGAASDGRALGLTAPRPEGQRIALDRAYAMAGVSPAEVGLVEAHGTGTVVGDRTELSVLTDVFTEAGAQPGQCALGSVKSQIGHTKCAAGLAGLIKTSLALHHGVRPPTLHLTNPNPAWDAEASPFAFHTKARPWAGDDRVAGVSAFGFGGTNFHVVLRAHDAPPSAHALDEWPAELFVLRGADAAKALLDEVERGGWRLRDHARGAARRSDVAAGRGVPVFAAFVAADVDELKSLLRKALAGTPAPGLYVPDGEPGKLAFLFPGQGSQRPGMLAELFVAFPELQHYLRLGARWADAVHPPAAFSEEGKAAQLARITDTRVAQPALGIAGLAAADLLAGLGIKPDVTAGHSYGELVALAAAGVFAPADLLAASAARAEAILDQVRDGDPGTMAAVTAAPAEVEAVLAAAGLADTVVAANQNSPTQTVVSGPTEAVDAAVKALRDNGFTVRSVRVACAFHSSVVAGAGEAFGATLADLPLRAPRLPVWANRTAAEYPADPDAVRAELAAQLGAPVRFADQIEAMYAAGTRTFVETGPGKVLTRLVAAVLGDRPHRVVTIDGGLPGFLAAVAQLAAAGVDLRIGTLFQGRDAADPTGRPAPKRAGWTVDGQLVRRADGQVMAGALQPARRVSLSAAPHVQAAPSGEGEVLVAEFLRSSREMISAQREVLLRYFGATPAEPPIALPPPVVEVEVVPEPVAAQPQRESVLDAVLAVVAERTGYPVDMIEPGLDLEADLSVDSIKRAEIAGELATRLGLPIDGDLEEVSSARTVSAIAELIQSRLGDPVVPTPQTDVLAEVLAVVAERTGYPVDMIEPGLDLEADLSVDSIKRAEIAGELASRLGLPLDGDLEEVSGARTARAIAELIQSRLGAPVAPARTDVLAEVLAVVAERTGYPVDMIDPTLDLEADLSVDSIKRAEIAGELASRLGLPIDGDLEEVSGARTAQAVADLIQSRLGEPVVPAPRTGGDLEAVVDVLAEVLAVVAERTGYPVDMIEPELDLEADLSVDSIKRAEIAGELATRLGLPIDGDLEEVSTARTATAIAALIESRLAGGTAKTATVTDDGGADIIAPQRLEFVETALPAPGPLAEGITVHVVGDHPVADLLAERLPVLRHPAGHVPDGGAVVFLDSLDAPETPLPEAFPWFKAVLATSPSHLIAVERRSASGLRGFFRTTAREYPDSRTRIVEVGAAAEAAEVVDALLAELAATDHEPVVLHRDGVRHGLRITPTDLGPLAATGAGPAGDGVAEAMATGLDRDAVVLLVGGAKGITARFAQTLAAAGRPRLELVGRTPVPADAESPDTASAADRDALRKVFIARGGLKPAEIEKAVRGVLAEREVRDTVSRLRELGSEVRYHCVDVLDDEAVRATIKDIHEERGRLDGVVYAAGVIEDKLIADKSVESFRRVFATKVDGARTLLDAIDGLPNGPRFAVLFGSIAGALGNRGQCDYAAANDALEELGRQWSTADRRGVTVHWGPWAGGGMVSPELMRSYAARGIKLIDPDEGPASLLRELAWGPAATHSVIYTASGW